MPPDLAQETTKILGVFGGWCLDDALNLAWVYRDAFLPYDVVQKGATRDSECAFSGV